MKRKPSVHHQKVSTKRSFWQPQNVIVVALIVVASIVAGLAITGKLSTEAAGVLGAVIAALGALSTTTRK